MSDHQIILGDALIELPKIKSESIDFILTDPPYGHNQNAGGDFCERQHHIRRKRRHQFREGERQIRQRHSGGKTLANDDNTANDLFRTSLKEYERILHKGCCAAVCCGGGGGSKRDGFSFQPRYAWWSIWMDEVLEFEQMIVWDKGPVGFGWHYRRCYEVVLVGSKPGEPMRWHDNSKRAWNVIRPWDDRGNPTGIRRIQARKETDHPTTKPVELAKLFLKYHTKPGDLVLDPFCGAGWVGVACKEMRRRFIGIEIDPQWYKVATERLDRTIPGFDL